MSLPLAQWLSQQRWYAGRNRTVASVTEPVVTHLSPDLDHMLVRVAYTDASSEVYQVVVAWDAPPAEEFVGVARIGEAGDRTAYDALYTESSARELLALIDAGEPVGTLRFVPEPGGTPVDGGTARVMDAEQSNSSVVFDASAVLKLFRRIVPGVNPDLELARALVRAGNPNVPPLLGAIEGTDERGQPLALATLTGFAASAADGWAMAVASARDLIGDPALRPEEAGGDFAAEAHRLGEAVAGVHLSLGEALGREVSRPDVDHLVTRLHEAAASVPELSGRLDAATAILERADLPTIVQRIHGDLHLGQALRTPEHWLIIDFEGEPGAPMAARRRPDSPMRDVAGMLRSFEYAAFQLLGDGGDDAQVGDRAMQWAARNVGAFCDGYAAASGVDPRQHTDLLAAYELDKACYEAAYETRHRPSWRWIPLRAIDRILSGRPGPGREPRVSRHAVSAQAEAAQAEAAQAAAAQAAAGEPGGGPATGGRVQP